MKVGAATLDRKISNFAKENSIEILNFFLVSQVLLEDQSS